MSNHRYRYRNRNRYRYRYRYRNRYRYRYRYRNRNRYRYRYRNRNRHRHRHRHRNRHRYRHRNRYRNRYRNHYRHRYRYRYRNRHRHRHRHRNRNRYPSYLTYPAFAFSASSILFIANSVQGISSIASSQTLSTAPHILLFSRTMPCIAHALRLIDSAAHHFHILLACVMITSFPDFSETVPNQTPAL
jgi:hypothetical protein